MMNLKSWKTTTVGVSQLVLGLTAFGLFAFGKINAIELGGTITFIVWIGSIVGNMFAKDGDKTNSKEPVETKSSKIAPIGGDGTRPEDEER